MFHLTMNIANVHVGKSGCECGYDCQSDMQLLFKCCWLSHPRYSGRTTQGSNPGRAKEIFFSSKMPELALGSTYLHIMPSCTACVAWTGTTLPLPFSLSSRLKLHVLDHPVLTVLVVIKCILKYLIWYHICCTTALLIFDFAVSDMLIVVLEILNCKELRS
jgi:hypothetical protein